MSNDLRWWGGADAVVEGGDGGQCGWFGQDLTQEEPTPQTIYRIGSKGKNDVMIIVPLRYVR
jgi:hypothetical protein